jgi:hypothetical protein
MIKIECMSWMLPKKPAETTYVRDALVLSGATLFWIFIAWVSYHIIHDGMSAHMMRYEAISQERHDEIWHQLVRDTLRKNVGFASVMLAIAILLGFAWVYCFKRDQGKSIKGEGLL